MLKTLIEIMEGAEFLDVEGEDAQFAFLEQHGLL